jgi:Asp-tRNA(Asn)/Glu-tRNA(Gln) amidotransferase A subunit family amidase
MTADALALWDRAVSDLKAAGAMADTFDAAVTRVNYQNAFAESAKARNDVPVASRSPAPTANALYQYFLGRTNSEREAREAVKRGYPAYRAFYNVLPETYEECEPLLTQPMTDDPAGRSFAKSRTAVVASLEASMRKANVTAMVYPTMPFSAPRAVDPWPDVRTPLGFGNWLGLPEVSVPAGMGADGMPGLNLSFVGLPGDDAKVLALAHAYETATQRRVAPRLT